MVIEVAAKPAAGRAARTARTTGRSAFMGISVGWDGGVNGRKGRKGQGGYNFSMKFQGTDTYVADDDLKLAVNAAITLERPLLIKGEPGTGKTLLAEEVARSLG